MKQITTWSNPYSFPINLVAALIILFLSTSVFASDTSNPALACTGTVISTFPYSESFENTTGDWTQNTGGAGGDQRNWSFDQNVTPSTNTGPSGPSDGGFYLYYETSNPVNNGDLAIITSPCIDLTAQTAAFFSFDYHMFGPNMGSLHVDISDDGTTWTNVFSRSGQQHTAQTDPWSKANIDLSSYAGNTINIRFRGIAGNPRSDMALDNIRISNSPSYCTSTASGTDGFLNDITRVSFNTINNSTPGIANNPNGGYGDFTAISTDVDLNSTHNLIVEGSTANFTFGAAAYIDWNRDGDFDDASETYDLGVITGGGNDNPTSNSPLAITIPSTASIGSTRMRVSLQFGAAPASCDIYTFGEVEDYTINVTSGVPQPEIDITGLGNSITDGDVTPDVSDNTDFGNVLVGNTNENIFTIENTGDEVLTLTDPSPYITITGANASHFSLTSIPTTPIAQSGGTTTFAINYTPTTGGTHNATVTIENDDSDENSYTFNISGNGIGPESEIAITGMGNNIVDGDTTPTATDGTDFGFLLNGDSAFRDFIISNSGTATLLLTDPSPYVTITGAADFSLTTSPNPSIATSGGSTTFRISYNPLAIGTHTATLSIANNDNDENPFTFDITGQSSAALVPEINMRGLGNSIPNGDVTPSIADNTNFGTIDVGTTNINDFSIENVGSGLLTLTDTSPYVTITGADAGQFSVHSIPDNTLNASQSTTFQIGYSPTTAGTHNAILTILNDDSDEGSYTFNIQGTAVVNTDPSFTIYYENFDSNNGGWTASNPGGNTVWTYGTNTTETGTEGNYWYTNNYNNYAKNSLTRVTSPTIDLTNYNNLKLQIDIRHDTSNDIQDGFNMEYSTNGGTTWTVLGAYAATPVDNWYNTDNVAALGAGTDGWAGRNSDNGSSPTQSSFLIAEIDLPTLLNNNPLARFRLTFASDGDTNVDDGVNFDNIFILGDPIIPFADPSLGPGDVTSNLKLWLKSNVGIAATDGNTVNSWDDEAFDNDARVAINSAPTYYDNSSENINHNPVIDFSTLNDTQLKGKGGFNTDEYWLVMQSDGNITSSSALEGVIAGRITTEDFAEDGTGFWINPGSIRFNGVDNIVSHMIGSTPASVSSPSEGNYGRSYNSSTDSYDNEVIIFNIKYDPTTNQSEIFKNGIKIDNFTGRSFDQSSGVSDGDLPYATVDNSFYVLGVGRITIMGTPFDSHFNGKITEVISYASPNSITDQSRIQSYLAIKNGITLHDINSTTATDLGDENYIDTDNNVLWNVATHAGFNYDIAGIGRDNDSGLNQKQSTSVNPGAIVTMGLTDIYDTNNENIANNPNAIADKNFLMWGNNNNSLAAAAPIVVDMSAGIAGLNTIVDFTSIERTWKVVETGTVGDVKISVPEIALSATLTPPGDYLMFISDTPTFSPTSEYRVMSLNGSNLETTFDFNGEQYITFGFAPEYIYERSITFDGLRDYIDADDHLDLTGPFTISFWMKHNNNSTSTVLSKSAANYTEGYEIRLLGNQRVNMRWRNASGVNQAISSNTSIPANEWHQVAFIYNGSRISIFIDGVLDRSANRTAPVNTDRHFLIAAEDERSPAHFYQGTLDEIRVWDIALTEDQVRFIMNQEIEENGDLTVAGKIVPTTISKNEFSASMWDSLKGYFPMNKYTYTNIKDESNSNLIAAIRNLDTVDFQTAPLPYISTNDGEWTAVSTWENGATQALPATASLVDNTITVDWNIVQTGHNITTNSNNTVLSLEVNSDELSIENDSKIEISHYLKLDGVIDLVDESQLVQIENSDLDTTSSGNIEKDQQGTSDTYSYNIWSAPVGSINTIANNQDYTVSDLMLDGSDTDNPINMLFSGGYDGAAGTPIIISAAWLWKFTNDPAGDYSSWQYVGPSGAVTPGQGYTMKGPGTGDVLDPQNYTFKGKPNNSTDTDEITFNIDAGNQYLIGNPFPSALDANDFIMDNPHLDGTLYFWQHWGGGTHILAGYQGGYATYTLAGGVPAVSHPSVDQTGSGTITPGRYIPVGQGFFAGASTTGTIVINNSQRNFVRENSGSSFFFLTDGQTDQTTTSSAQSNSNTENASLDDSYFDAPDLRQKFRIIFDSPQQFHRELLLTIDEATTLGYDRMYDGINPDGPEDDMKWMIDDYQATIQAVEKIEDGLSLPLQLKTAAAGTSVITLTDILNEDLDVDIYLYDALDASTTNLKVTPFIVELAPGEYNERFFIVFRAEEETNDVDTSDDTDDDIATGDDTPDDTDDDTTTGDDTPDDTDDDTTTGDDDTPDDTDHDTTTGDDTSNDTDDDSTTGDDTSNDTDDDPTTDVDTDNDTLSSGENSDEITLMTLRYDIINKSIVISKAQSVNVSEVNLYNILGQVIKQWQPNSNTKQIELPVQSISSGAYLVYIQTETGMVSEKLIIH